MNILSVSIAIALPMSLALNIFQAVLLARKNAPRVDEALNNTSPETDAAEQRRFGYWSY